VLFLFGSLFLRWHLFSLLDDFPFRTSLLRARSTDAYRHFVSAASLTQDIADS
jgi:hypothetical protein